MLEVCYARFATVFFTLPVFQQMPSASCDANNYDIHFLVYSRIFQRSLFVGAVIVSLSYVWMRRDKSWFENGYMQNALKTCCIRDPNTHKHKHTTEHYNNNQTIPCSLPDISYIIACDMCRYHFHCACYRNSEINFFCFLLFLLDVHFNSILPEIYLCLLFASTNVHVPYGCLLVLSKMVRFIHQQNALRSFHWIDDFSTTEISNVQVFVVAQRVVTWVGWLRWSVQFDARKLSLPISFSWTLFANKHCFFVLASTTAAVVATQF